MQYLCAENSIFFTHETHFPVIDERKDFIDALESFLLSELRSSLEPAEYNAEAIEIIDARNHLFRNVGRRGTDEELGIYDIRDLLRIDEDTMETIPDRGRFAAIAKELGIH